jgi:hypothetical protein
MILKLQLLRLCNKIAYYLLLICNVIYAIFMPPFPSDSPLAQKEIGYLMNSTFLIREVLKDPS